jgi:hypothetical protein
MAEDIHINYALNGQLYVTTPNSGNWHEEGKFLQDIRDEAIKQLKADVTAQLNLIKPFPDHLSTCAHWVEQTSEFCDCGYKTVCWPAYLELGRLLK